MNKELEQALALPGCERLRDFAEVGPAQRAALELFVGALSAPEEVWRQFALMKLGAIRDNMTNHEVEVVQRFLSGEPAPSALSAQEPGTVVVPVEPTGAMLVTGSEAGDIGMGPLKRAYAAMLSAAPKGSSHE